MPVPVDSWRTTSPLSPGVTSYSFDFSVVDASDVHVYVTVQGAQAPVEYTRTSAAPGANEFTVRPNIGTVGGTVTIARPNVSGSITIQRETPYTLIGTVRGPRGETNPDAADAQLDRLERQIQQVAGRPAGTGGGGVSGDLPSSFLPGGVLASGTSDTVWVAIRGLTITGSTAVIDITELEGMPPLSSGRYLATNAAGTALEFVEAPAGTGGSSTFRGLTETPSTNPTGESVFGTRSTGAMSWLSSDELKSFLSLTFSDLGVAVGGTNSVLSVNSQGRLEFNEDLAFSPVRQRELLSSVPHDGVTLNGDVLTFASHGAGSTPINLQDAIQANVPSWALTGYAGKIPDALLPDAATVRDFLVTAATATDPVEVTAQGSDAGAFAAWKTLMTLPAITGEQEGLTLFIGSIRGEFDGTPADGNDRVKYEARLVRNRAASDTVLKTISPDSLDNTPAASGTTSAAYATAVKGNAAELVSADRSMPGDVYRVEVRAVAEATSGTRTVDFTDATNSLVMVPVSGITGRAGSAYTDSEADARVAAGVWAWALRVNNSLIPTNKLATGTADATTYYAGDQTFKALPEGHRLPTAAEFAMLLAANTDYRDIKATSDALHTTTTLNGFDGRAFRVAIGNASYIVNNAGATVPEARAGRKIIAIAGSTAPFEFFLTQLHALPAIAAGAQMNDMNSLSWQAGSEVFRIGRQSGTTERFLASSDTVGAKELTIRLKDIDTLKDAPIEDFARTDKSDLVEAAKLGTGTRDGTRFLRDDQTWQPVQQGPSMVSVGPANELSAFAVVPAIAGFSVGDIINVGGDILVLVDSDDHSNQVSGTAARINSTYIGAVNVMGSANDYGSFTDPSYQGEVSWAPSGVDPVGVRAFRARLPKSALTGVTSGTVIWMDIEQPHLSTLNGIRLIRDSARDTTTLWAFRSSDQSDRIDAGVGDPFTARFFSDAARSTGLDIHAADRWEPYEQVHPQHGAGGGGGGISATDFNTMLDAAIPTKRRLPDYDSTDAGKVPKVNAGGTAITWEDDNAGTGGVGSITQSNAYNAVKAIMQSGRGIAITADDAQSRLIVKTGVSAAGNSFPASPEEGDEFDLLQTYTAPYPAVLHSEQNQAGQGDAFGWYSQVYGTLDIGPAGGLRGISWWDNTSEVPQTQRDRVVVYTGGAGSKTPNQITIAGTNYALTAIAGQRHVYRTPEIVSNPLPVNTDVTVQVRYTDNTLAWPDREYEPHIYAFDGVKWRKASILSAEDIRDLLQSLTGEDRLDISAIKGEVAARFQQILHTDPIPGLAITNVNSDRHSNFQLFNPAFDLDDVTAGTFVVEATVTIGTSSGTQQTPIGFGSTHEQHIQVDGTLFASALKTSTIYAMGFERGVAVGDPRELYVGSALAGTLRTILARNSDSELGFYFVYRDNDQTTTSGNLTLAFTMAAAWNPADSSGMQAASSGITVKDDGVTEGTEGTVDSLNIEGGQGVSRTADEVTASFVEFRTRTAADYNANKTAIDASEEVTIITDAVEQEPVGTARGDLVATSQSIKTSRLFAPAGDPDSATAHPTIMSNTSQQFFPAAGLADGYGSYVDGTVQDPSGIGALVVPNKAATGVFGFWLVSKTAGVEVSSVFMPYTPGITRDDPDGYQGTETQTFLVIRAATPTAPDPNQNAVVARIRMNLNERQGAYSILFDAESDRGNKGAAANTVIEVYTAIARGEKGEQGEQGPGEPEGVRTVTLSGSFVPAAAGVQDNDITQAEWDGNAGFRFTGIIAGTSEANPYIVRVPWSTRNAGRARWFMNDSNAWMRLMSSNSLSTNGRSYRGADSISVAPNTSTVISMASAQTLDAILPGGEGSAYTAHTSLSTLPTSGMTVGDLHVVTEGSGATASVTRFVAVSATQLKCVGGVSADLVNRNVGTPAGGSGGSPLAVTTARQWRRIPVSATGTTAPWMTWDYRFPLMLVNFGGRNNTSGPWNYDNTWYTIDTNAIRGLTAASSGQAQVTGTFIEVGRHMSSTLFRVVAFGRTANNEILVNLHDTALQAFPLRIRGGSG